MSFGELVRAGLRMPPGRAARGALRLGGRALRQRWVAARDRVVSTRAKSDATLAAYLPMLEPEVLLPHVKTIGVLCDQAINHRFNLLGSGWVNVAYGMEAQGAHGLRCPAGKSVDIDSKGDWLVDVVPGQAMAAARRTWSCVSVDYRPIDWQIDYRTGYRWSAKRPAYQNRVAPLPGADIKMPWELARMQHLIHLAEGHAADRLGLPGVPDGNKCLREFQDQILDFIATNPPRFGVNWTTSMDVGIRLANWLVARDLFIAHGATMDPLFERELAGSVVDHLQHICGHLEWDPDLRGNHYLANIAGVLFGAAYLSSGVESNAMVAWATQQLSHETTLQFHDEGTNFEGSTSYHRLSAEMAAYASALALRVQARSKPGRVPTYPRVPVGEFETTPFAPDHWQRIFGAAAFCRAIETPDGGVVQIGDTDNGRFLKVEPTFIEGPEGLDENHLDHRPFVRAIEDWTRGKTTSLEGAVLRGLAGPHCPAENTGSLATPPNAGLPDGLSSQVRSRRFEADCKNLTFHSFPEFGLHTWAGGGTYLAVRCGSIGQRGHGGHGHNDQLSIELWINGRPVIRDPGSYVYTADINARNRYRSVHAHDTPWNLDEEPEPLDVGTFQLPASEEPVCRHAGPDGFHGTYRHTARIIRIEPDRIVVIDVPGRKRMAPPPFSPGYGLGS